MTTLTYHRISAIDAFHRTRRRAWWRSLGNSLLSRQNRLQTFTTVEPRLGLKTYEGVQEIPLKAIVGSVGRESDFDRNFHPRKDHLEGRWVELYVMAHARGWPPIQLYQVGQHYYVLDGHHRVSVAHHLHNPTISAEVWQYRLNPGQSSSRGAALSLKNSAINQFCSEIACT